MYVADLPPLAIYGIAFVFGSLWGSFFNVAIYRWPLGMSVVTPPSHCPACSAPISARWNVPIFGWLLLGGKAKCCNAPLSPRYPLVELLSAVLCAAIAHRFVLGAGPDANLFTSALEALVYFAFVGGLVIATFVDLEHMEIPDEVSLPGAALGLATAPLRSMPGAEAAALGAGGGFLVIQLLFVWVYERLTGRRGMGEGDAKLLLMIGAFLGWRGALFVLIAGSIQGLVAAIILLALGKRTAPEPKRAPDEAASQGSATPTEGSADDGGDAPPQHVGHVKVTFGPFLALASIEFLFFGEQILAAYTRL